MTDGGMRFLLWIPSYSILVKTFHQWTVWYSFRNSRDRFSVYRCSNTTSINNTYATKRMMDVWYAVDSGDQATCEWAITFTSSMMRIISVRCKKSCSWIDIRDNWMFSCTTVDSIWLSGFGGMETIPDEASRVQPSFATHAASSSPVHTNQ